MTTINLSAITPALLAAAVQNNDLDAALRPVMQAAGITDGGVAGRFFSCDGEALWGSAHADQRMDMLKEWIASEQVHLDNAGPSAPLALLRAVVQAKLAYWDALNALEVAIAPHGEFSDRANDAVVDQIDYLVDGLAAAGSDDVTQVTEDHLATIVKMARTRTVPY